MVAVAVIVLMVNIMVILMVRLQEKYWWWWWSWWWWIVMVMVLWWCWDWWKGSNGIGDFGDGRGHGCDNDKLDLEVVVVVVMMMMKMVLLHSPQLIKSLEKQTVIVTSSHHQAEWLPGLGIRQRLVLRTHGYFFVSNWQLLHSCCPSLSPQECIFSPPTSRISTLLHHPLHWPPSLTLIPTTGFPNLSSLYSLLPTMSTARGVEAREQHIFSIKLRSSIFSPACNSSREWVLGPQVSSVRNGSYLVGKHRVCVFGPSWSQKPGKLWPLRN